MKQKLQVEITRKRHMSKSDIFLWISVKWHDMKRF